jgi:hypothetical protein
VGLTRIFKSKREEETGGCGKLDKDKRQHLWTYLFDLIKDGGKDRTYVVYERDKEVIQNFSKTLREGNY